VNETIDITRLRETDGFWYLCSPYTKYHLGIDAATEMAAGAAVWLRWKHHIRVFSPIVCTHEIAAQTGIDPLDCDFWLGFDDPIIDKACGAIVLMLKGWRESHGVGVEIAKFTADGKPVVYMQWPRIKP